MSRIVVTDTVGNPIASAGGVGVAGSNPVVPTNFPETFSFCPARQPCPRVGFFRFPTNNHIGYLNGESEMIMTHLKIHDLIDDVIAREGDFVNHPADRGGPTRWGITQAVAARHGYHGDMRLLPRSEAAAIYEQRYWLAPAFNQVAALAPRLAAELFDTGVNMGTAAATAFLQRALNALNRNQYDYQDIRVDRNIGPATLRALRAFLRVRGPAAERILIKAVDALQGAHYVRLAEVRPSQEAFLYGWLANRIG